MFIQTEATPNPDVLKFIPGRPVMDTPADFPNRTAAAASPLAEALFHTPEVAGVFLGADFIAVTKSEGDWAHLKPALLTTIMEHFVSGQPMMHPDALEASDAPVAEGEDAEIVAAICEILDTRVRPAVARDGGDIVFHGYHDGVVSLHMRGACAGCPSATQTLKHGIENLLRHYVPSVRAVHAVM